jgi:hypothetical protein
MSVLMQSDSTIPKPRADLFVAFEFSTCWRMAVSVVKCNQVSMTKTSTLTLVWLRKLSTGVSDRLALQFQSQMLTNLQGVQNRNDMERDRGVSARVVPE